jgi:predicted lipoprotein with Yx(FWY)xxD motif
MDTPNAARSRLLVVVLALVSAALLTAVGSAAAGRTGSATVMVRSSSLGKIIVDAKGRTLYLFEKDKGKHSSCSGKCATFWPPLLTKGKPTAGAGAKTALLGTTRRSNGSMQVTYAGHPLYRYLEDTKAGQTKGEGSKAFGAGWYVLAPNGKKIDKD